jgi:hypothetical protein
MRTLTVTMIVLAAAVLVESRSDTPASPGTYQIIVGPTGSTLIMDTRTGQIADARMFQNHGRAAFEAISAPPPSGELNRRYRGRGGVMAPSR